MKSIDNQRLKICITVVLLLLITILGDSFVLRLELGERGWMFGTLILVPAIIIAIIGTIVFVVKDAPVYRSFFKVVFIAWSIIHVIWSIFSKWFYDVLSSVGWI